MASRWLSARFLGVTAGYLRRLDRRRDHALHRPDDGLSGAAARHRARGDLQARACGSSALVIAMVNWVQIARVIYTETASLAEREFIEAERALGAGHAAHPVPPHPAASGADDHRLGHARHRHHGAARGDAVLSRRRRAAADAVLGQHHLREPDLFPSAPWLVFIPGRRDPARWRSPSTWSATRCATSSTRRRGARG